MPLYSLEPISLAYGLNHYSIDKPLQDMLNVFSKKGQNLDELGKFVGRDVYEVAYRVDSYSEPVLVNWGVNGKRTETVLLDPYERKVLIDLVKRFEVNTYPFIGKSWHNHYASLYLIGDPGLSCILTITIQTAYALYKYGGDEIKSLYRNLAGLEEPYYWGATWFTEVQGGSDLGANTTSAYQDGGKWFLDGYKYFASGAGIADYALVTARIKGARPGAKGLSLFLVPRIGSTGRINFYVRRLKRKSGTVPVPTGEVELIRSEAFLIGEPDKGIYYTMEDLMVSRLANSVGALGIARKAYIEMYGYSMLREAFGKKISKHPLLIRDLFESEALLESMLLLTFHAIDVFDSTWHAIPPYNNEYHYARLLTHIVKNMTAKVSSQITQTAMEVFGGIGFLREFPFERWHREALITPIWEGTSNIQALDMMEAIFKKGAHRVLLEKMESYKEFSSDPELSEKAFLYLQNKIKKIIELNQYVEEYSKVFLEDIGITTSIILLLNFSRKTGDEAYGEIARYMFTRYIENSVPELIDKELTRKIVSLRYKLNNISWEEKVREYSPGD